MDPERARHLLRAERDEVRQLLSEATSAGRQDWVAERETGGLRRSPRNQLTDGGISTTPWRRVLARVGSRRSLRAEQRRQWMGHSARSIRSGLPIPDERLEADPAAELTVEEARSQRYRPAGAVDRAQGGTARPFGRRAAAPVSPEPS